MPLVAEAELTLYSHRQSRGRSVLWLLEELGVDYAVQWLDFGADMRTPQFLALNPMGKIPVLTHHTQMAKKTQVAMETQVANETQMVWETQVVTETPAILTYLADQFADRGMIPPAGDASRAAFYRWLFFAAGPLEAATTATFFGWQVPERTANGTSGAGFVGFGSLTRTLDVLADQLTQAPYVCGAQMTAADIYLASQLSLGIYYTKSFASRPVFDDYLARLHARPAKLRAEAI